MIVTNEGNPIEVHFKPGSEGDVNVLCEMALDISSDSELYADGAYSCFDLEDVLQDEQIRLLVKSGVKAKIRVLDPIENRKISSRQIIETAFSCITNLFTRNFRVRTEAGFLIKVFVRCLPIVFHFYILARSFRD